MGGQLNQMQAMMEQLVKMVGQNNAAVNEMRQELTGVRQGITELKQDNQAIRNELIELRQSQARMEHELTNKVRALFDTREVQNDVNERILDSLASIQADVNYLVTKTAQHNAEISRMQRTRKAK